MKWERAATTCYVYGNHSLTVEADLDALERLAPSGYFVALRMGFVFPLYEKKTLPQKWIDAYSSRAYVLVDPVMHWMYQNVGCERWSALNLPDDHGVLANARLYGLRYGAAVCCKPADENGPRSFGSFARSDREFTDSEMAELEAHLCRLHRAMIPPTNLTNAELEALRMVKNGLLMKEIADLLGVSEGAVKLRLKNAKLKLKAKTSTHAAAMATTFGLI